MGISGITWLLRNRAKSQVFDLIDEGPGTLFIDQYAFTFGWVNLCVKGFVFPNTTRVERGNYTLYRASLIALFYILKFYKLSLEIFADGAYRLGTNEGEANADKWRQRKSIQDNKIWECERAWRNSSCFSEAGQAITEAFKLNMFTNCVMRNLCLRMNIPYWCCCGGADHKIAAFMKKRVSSTETLSPVIGVLSNDSDFGVSKDCRWIPMDTFDYDGTLRSAILRLFKQFPALVTDPSYLLPWNAFQIWARKNLGSMTISACAWTPNDIATLCKVAPEDLPILAILCGNDETKHLLSAALAAQRTVKIIPGRPLEVGNSINRMKRAGNLESSLDRLMTKVPELKLPFYRSHLLYLWKSKEDMSADELKVLENDDMVWETDFEVDSYIKWRLYFISWFDDSSKAKPLKNPPVPKTLLSRLYEVPWDSSLENHAELTEICKQLSYEAKLNSAFLQLRCGELFVHDRLSWNPLSSIHFRLCHLLQPLDRLFISMAGCTKPFKIHYGNGHCVLEPLKSLPKELRFDYLAQSNPNLSSLNSTIRRLLAIPTPWCDLHLDSLLITFLLVCITLKLPKRNSFVFDQSEILSLIVSISLGLLRVSRLTDNEPVYSLTNDLKDWFMLTPEELGSIRKECMMAFKDGKKHMVIRSLLNGSSPIFYNDPRNNLYHTGWKTILSMEWFQRAWQMIEVPITYAKAFAGCIQRESPNEILFNIEIFRAVHSAYVLDVLGTKERTRLFIDDSLLLSYPIVQGEKLREEFFKPIAKVRETVLKTPTMVKLTEALGKFSINDRNRWGREGPHGEGSRTSLTGSSPH